MRNAIDKIKGFFNFSWVAKAKAAASPLRAALALCRRVCRISAYLGIKAMDTPMLLNNPTIFGAAGALCLAQGEAGLEVVSGAATLMDMIRSVVDDAQQTDGRYARHRNCTLF